MNDPTEFFLLFTCGYALYEYGVRRYFGMAERKLWVQGAVLFVIEFVITIKYTGLGALGVQAGFVAAYLLISLMIPNGESKERNLLEKFILKNGVLALLLVIVYRTGSGIAPNGIFDSVWNVVTGGGTESGRTFLKYGIGYLFVLDGGTTMVRGLLNKIPIITRKALASHEENVEQSEETEESTELKNAGELIGIIERLLIVTFVIAGSFNAVAFTFAAKSIARYKELDNKDFAEYYLLGTTASVIVAVAAGILLRLQAG